MKHPASVFIAVLTFLSLSSLSLAVEVPLKYDRFPDNRQGQPQSGFLNMQLFYDLPAGEWVVPELKFEHTLYMFVSIGDTKRLCLFDFQKKNDPFFNRLYFDSNGNRDLTDDAVVDGTLNSSGGNRYFNTQFPAIDTKVTIDSVQLPYSFKPYISGQIISGSASSKNNQNTRLNFPGIHCYCFVNCSYSAEFKVDGRNVHIILGDMNGNGRFSDRFTKPQQGANTSPRRRPIYSPGDRIFLSNGDKSENTTGLICGDFLVVNGKLFEMDISTVKGILTLIEITDGLVPVKLAMDVEQLSLYTEDTGQCVNAYQPGETINLPPGSYRILSYQAFRNDKQGDRWRLNAAGTYESLFISVTPNSSPVLEFGEPFVPLVDINANIRNSGIASQVPLYFNIEGKGKEFVTNLLHISGDKTKLNRSKIRGREHYPKEPSYRIVKSDGEVVASGSFEYG